MTRPTRVRIDTCALIHNLRQVQRAAPGKRIIAMVKANAYGCGLHDVLPILEQQVDAFGVASIEEALMLRRLGSRTACVLFQGVFTVDELHLAVFHRLQCVIHQDQQLQWILNTPLSSPLRVWVKLDTGMHRLGFSPHCAQAIIKTLKTCPWVDSRIGIMTHLACADEPHNSINEAQLRTFYEVTQQYTSYERSIANSAAILALPDSHADVVRPGIMLYGVSPFLNQTGCQLGLKPVMHFTSAVSAIHHYPPGAKIGYGGTWSSPKPSMIGVVPVGYGDGYPRHQRGAMVWVQGELAPVVGHVSMDMLTIDLTHCPLVQVGHEVELWGKHIPVESIAKTAGTIPYEILCQVSSRARSEHRV